MLRVFILFSLWSVINPEETDIIDQKNSEAIEMLSKNLDQAKEIAERNYLDAKSIDYLEGMATAKFISGYVYDEQRIYDKSLLDYLESISLDKSNKVRISKVYLNIGRIFKVYGEFELANHYYSQSLNYSNDKLRADVLYNLGNLSKNEGQYQKAMQYYIDGFEHCKKTKDHLRLAKILNQMGVVLQRIGEHDDSREYFFQVINHPELNQYKKYYGFALHNVAYGYFLEGENEKALEYYHKSLIQKEGHQKYLSLYDIAKVYLAMGNNEKAEKYFFQALPYLSQKDNEPKYFEIYKSLAESFSVANEFQEAVHYQSLYSGSLEAHLREQNNLIQIQEKNHVKWIVGNFEKQQYIESLSKNHILEITVLVMSGTILILSILLFVRYQSRKKKERLKEKLDKWESDLEF